MTSLFSTADPVDATIVLAVVRGLLLDRLPTGDLERIDLAPTGSPPAWADPSP